MRSLELLHNSIIARDNRKEIAMSNITPAVILPSGETRPDYIRRRLNQGHSVKHVRRELECMIQEHETHNGVPADQLTKVRYQTVFNVAKRMNKAKAA